MPGKKFYVGAKQLAELEIEAASRNMDVEELITRKLQQFSTPSTDVIDDLQQAVVTLANKVQNLELILKRYCVLNEAELLDLGYLRGAIEVQASQNIKAVRAAKQTEQQRLQLSKQIKEEIEKYLK